MTWPPLLCGITVKNNLKKAWCELFLAGEKKVKRVPISSSFFRFPLYPLVLKPAARVPPKKLLGQLFKLRSQLKAGLEKQV